jgi:hypothetical protein
VRATGAWHVTMCQAPASPPVTERRPNRRAQLN